MVCFMGLKVDLNKRMCPNFGASLVLGKPDAADIRLAEDRSRDELVIDRAFQPAKLASGEGHAFGQRYRGQFHTADDIAEGKNARFGRAVFRVDVDAAGVVDLHVHALQAQAFEVGFASRGVEHRIDLDAAAIGKQYLQATGALGD